MLRKTRARARQILFYASSAVFMLGTVATIIHPYGFPKKTRDRTRNLETVVKDQRTLEIVARSCVNCHSDDTKWPWYSYVPPTLWLVEKDVAEARAKFNLSSWVSYNNEQKSEILADIARVVANREMPLPHYLLLHKEARLSDADAEAIVKWAGRERRALRTRGASGNQLTSGEARPNHNRQSLLPYLP